MENDEGENNNENNNQRPFTLRFCEKWYTTHQKSRWKNQLHQRIQKPGETVNEYKDAIIQLYQRIDPEINYPMMDHI